MCYQEFLFLHPKIVELYEYYEITRYLVRIRILCITECECVLVCILYDFPVIAMSDGINIIANTFR